MTAGLMLTTAALKEVAEDNGVCARPIVHKVTDTVTGRVRLVPTPCGATLASKCAPCAKRNRSLRMQQCREGWHLEEEPERAATGSTTEEGPPTEDDPAPERRVRSTRRRQDAPDLPSLPIEDRTVGRSFTSRSGRTYRPSMFVTFTLPSYGPVRSDGTPVWPSTYNYRRAALDALHFPKLIDRLWQNLRRAVGWKVQYFSTIEPQRRLAPHLHAAVRGAIPRETFREVVAATYHQVWWPDHSTPRYVEHLPLWVEGRGYVDPDSRCPLPTWEQALDILDADESARPAHVMRFGRQLDLQGILATEDDADRRVAYLTKYLAKDFGQAFADDEELTPRQRRHLERLHEQVRFLPCSPRCANWLRYGVQPQGATEGLRARQLRIQGPRPRAPRLRRAPGAGLPAVDRQDAHRPPGRPSRGRAAGARVRRHRGRRCPAPRHGRAATRRLSPLRVGGVESARARRCRSTARSSPAPSPSGSAGAASTTPPRHAPALSSSSSRRTAHTSSSSRSSPPLVAVPPVKGERSSSPATEGP